jgi:3-phenylpropionate/trans-cinnamate dioxygenase ferredoxin reductase subunit
VPNALEQARQAAAHITGHPAPVPEVPWFWSDQYDVKLQIAGLVVGGETLVVRGDTGHAKFALFHLRDGIVQAVETVNSPAEFMIGRKLIASRKPVDPLRLADVGIPMKELAT